MDGRLPVLLLASVACGFAIGWFARPLAEEPEITVELPGSARGTPPARPPVRADPPSGREPGPAGPPPPRDPSAPRPSRLGSRRDVLGLFAVELRQAYRRLSDGGEATADQIERTVERHGQQLDSAAEAWAGMLWRQEERRRAFGELSNPAAVVLQVRTTSPVEVAMVDARPPRHRPPRRDEPLDLARGIEAQAPTETFVAGGLVPEGQVFAIERIEVEARWLRDTRVRPRGSFDLDVPGWERDLNVRAAGRRLRAVYEGLGILEPGEEEGLKLGVRDGAVSVRISGRILPREDVPWPSRQTFRATVFDGDGYLTGEPVLLQIACGRNRGQVSLDPLEGRGPELADRDLWGEPIDLDGRQRPHAYAQHRGRIPPGQVYEIHRILYRIRPALEKGEAAFRLGKEWILDPRDALDRETAGTWTGSHILRPGQEGKIELRATRAMAEVRLYGTLRDP